MIRLIMIVFVSILNSNNTFAMEWTSPCVNNICLSSGAIVSMTKWKKEFGNGEKIVNPFIDNDDILLCYHNNKNLWLKSTFSSHGYSKMQLTEIVVTEAPLCKMSNSNKIEINIMSPKNIKIGISKNEVINSSGKPTSVNIIKYYKGSNSFRNNLEDFQYGSEYIQYEINEDLLDFKRYYFRNGFLRTMYFSISE